MVFASSQKKSSETDRLILRINDLGAEQELHAMVEPLQTALANSKNALNALNQSIEEVKTAEALELIAKINLVRQYEQNDYAVSSRFGKQFANRLFPKITLPAKPQEDEDEN